MQTTMPASVDDGLCECVSQWKVKMRAVRFELTHPKIPEPKSGALNHSAKLPDDTDCKIGDLLNMDQFKPL